MKNLLKTLILIISLFSISNANTHKPFIPKSDAPVSNIFFQPNNVNTCFRSDGIFNYDKINFAQNLAGLIWPVSAAQRLTIDYSSGIWIGAKINGDIRTAVSMYNSTFSPGNVPILGQVPPSTVCSDSSFKGYLVNLVDQSLVNGGVRTKIAGGNTYYITYDAWSNWPVDKGAPYVEVNGIPGYQPGWNGDRPGIGNSNARPDEISFMVFMDYTNCTDNLHIAEISLPGGTLPLGVEIQQVSFAVNIAPYADMYFIKWKIINKSSNIWDSTYICIADDPDIGDGTDDAAGCDSVRQMGYAYNGDNYDPMYGNAPPAVGYRILQSPMKQTGNPLDTAKLPYGIYIGYKLIGLTGYNVFINTNDPCAGDPSDANAGYFYMTGRNGCGNPLVNPITNIPTKFKYNNRLNCEGMWTGWYDSIPSDVRQIMSMGPLNMHPSDTQIIVTSVMAAKGIDYSGSVCQLLSLSDLAKQYYDTNFVITPIGIRNNSSEIPETIKLYQNYPNPFNPNTKIKFQIAKLWNAKLTIYDALGREVTTLVNEQLRPGTYEVEWDGTNYASGIYCYRLLSGNYSEIRKMILLK